MRIRKPRPPPFKKLPLLYSGPAKKMKRFRLGDYKNTRTVNAYVRWLKKYDADVEVRKAEDGSLALKSNIATIQKHGATDTQSVR